MSAPAGRRPSADTVAHAAVLLVIYDHWTVSRGPSRRVRRLRDAGHLSDELLARADREADLLEHPYIGVVHVELPRMRLAGKVTERQALLNQLTRGVRRRWGDRLDHTRRFVATALSKRAPPVEPLRKTSADRTDLPRIERSLMPDSARNARSCRRQ